MLTTILGYFVILQFFALDSSRRSGEARSLEPGQFDRRSTMYVGMAYLMCILALLLSWLLNALGLGKFSAWAGWLGLALAVCGLLLRWWANRTLGAFYTRTLKVVERQIIVHDGPYRLIRHPGYLGSMLMWIGAAIATVNWIVVFIVVIVMLGAYVYRIQSEEKMLLATIPEYGEYGSHTWKLIPFLY